MCGIVFRQHWGGGGGGGRGCNSIEGGYFKSGRFYALESHQQRIEKLWPRD